MASNSQPSPVFSWQFFVLVFASLGLFINQPGTLPIAPGNDGWNRNPEAKEDRDNLTVTDSRLWADPYTNSQESNSGPRDASSGFALGSPGVSAAILESIAAGQICVMPVIVRGDSNSAEAHEMRIRFRIATANGLGAAGYSPDDPTHVMWVKINLCRHPAEAFPAEWFLRGGLARHRSVPYDAILVVWIRDSVLFTYPLEELKCIRE
jgi:hypothetical protein